MKCDVCNAKVSELRRGRCWGCYSHWVEARPVGLGAACCICSERRRSHLRSLELLGSWMPTCFDCSGRVAKLQPLPQTLKEVRECLERDRRNEARRLGKRDTRVFQYNRRSTERREDSARGDCMQIDENMILCVEELAMALDKVGAAPALDELTRICEAPGDSRQ